MRENDQRQTPEVRPQPAMTVHCPHCSTGYLLPDHLVGPRGARVRCPNCQGAFVVLAGSGGAGTGEPSAVDPAPFSAAPSGPSAEPTGQPSVPGSSPGPDASPAPADEPDAIATAILDALVAKLGDDLVRARRAGRVLSAHGPSIMDAFAEYRRRVGADAPPDPFRTALAGRCGVDLMPRQRA